MYESLFSQSWYRVADIKPQLRSNARWVRQTFRDENWYVLRDISSGKLHRFSQASKLVIEQMDGQRSMQDIWEAACTKLGDDMPGQDELIHLLSQLYRANVLQSTSLPDIDELVARKQKEDSASFWQVLKSPMAVRLPIWNPQHFFKRLEWLGKIIFGPVGVITLLLLLIFAGLELVLHWQPLTENFQDSAFSASNWLLIALVYPVVKLFHEVGHGLAVRRWGGDVRELGLMFLVFIPVPYVDASDASLFYKKYQRIIVSLAGIFVELGLAAIATLLWVIAEPGVARALLFNVMLIGGFSTLLFNGNPLLKFDAYFALSDYLELPNMAQRSNKYLGYLGLRYVLRQEEESPATGKREALWLTSYSILSFFYRLVVMLGIALFVATKYFFVGVLLACWTLYQSFFAPFLRTFKSLWKDSSRRYFRRRLVLALSVSCVLLVTVFALLPMPHYTVAHGVYWAPEQAQIRAGADCLVTDVVVSNKSSVQAGDVVVRCQSAQLRANLQLVNAQLKELQVRRRGLLTRDLLEAELLKEEIARMHEELIFAKQQFNAMTITSSQAGNVHLLRPQDLPGRFIRRGTYMGYVDNGGVNDIRVAVPQNAVFWVRADVKNLEMRRAGSEGRVYKAKLVRELPLANTNIPNAALTTEGGGDIVLDPQSKDDIRALENWFQFDVVTDVPAEVGERVYLRFTHSPEPLYKKLSRQVRSVFLRKFSV